MNTNPTKQIVNALDKLPEIKAKKNKSSLSGMMSPILKKSMPTKSGANKEPLFSVIKTYQQIKRNRMEILGAKKNGD